MVQLITSADCSKCMVVKGVLEANKIEFTLTQIESLSPEERKDLVNRAKKEKKLSLPLILNDGKIVDLQGVLSNESRD